MKRILFALALFIAADVHAARRPQPPQQPPPIAVDTHDLYPDHAPSWWHRFCRMIRAHLLP